MSYNKDAWNNNAIQYPVSTAFHSKLPKCSIEMSYFIQLKSRIESIVIF